MEAKYYSMEWNSMIDFHHLMLNQVFVEKNNDHHRIYTHGLIEKHEKQS